MQVESRPDANVQNNIFGLVDLHTEKLFKLRLDNTTRGHEFKIIPEHSVIDIRNHFFVQRISQV